MTEVQFGHVSSTYSWVSQLSSYRVVSGKLRITLCGLLKHLALQFHLWFQKQRLEAELRCHGMPRDFRLCWNTNLWGQWNQTWQPHAVACLWQTWLMNMEWSVNIGLFEHALRTWFWTILRRIQWFWWSSFFIFCAKWRCSFLKSDNSVVTTCDNLEFHNGINSLSTAMAVLRSRPDPTGPWAQVIQTTLPIDAVVWSIYSPEERSAAWASPTVQQSNSPTWFRDVSLWFYCLWRSRTCWEIQKDQTLCFKPFGSIWIILKNKMFWICLKNLKNTDILSYNELQATFEVVF